MTGYIILRRPPHHTILLVLTLNAVAFCDPCRRLLCSLFPPLSRSEPRSRPAEVVRLHDARLVLHFLDVGDPSSVNLNYTQNALAQVPPSLTWLVTPLRAASAPLTRIKRLVVHRSALIPLC
jgi:hypothetical protein